ncbi:MAG: CARDB domain-containing protein, partial [Chloroflexota bacterium]
MGKICSILLALALVLSFGVVATPVSADQWAELTVNITAPLDGADIIGGTEFTVSANVTNNGTAGAEDVKATIEISGNATLKAGEDATKYLVAQLGVGNTTQVSWTLVCTGGGTVNVTVSPSGKDPITFNPIVSGYLHPDTVSVVQEKVLEVTIVAPSDGYALNVTDEFEVKANVKNISSLNATDVELTISIDRYAGLKTGEVALRTVGALDSGATSDNYTWTLECTGDGFSMITVSPSGKVEIEEVEEDIPADALTPATVTVEQGVFEKESIDLVEGWNLISLP